MLPSISGASIGQKIQNVVGSITNASNNRRGGAAQGLGVSMNAQPATPIMTGATGNGSMREHPIAAQYAQNPSNSYSVYEDGIHWCYHPAQVQKSRVQRDAGLLNGKVFHAIENNNIGQLSDLELARLDPRGCFGGKKLRDFEAQDILRFRAGTPPIPDNNVDVPDNNPLLLFNGEEVNGEMEATSKDADWEAFMDEWDDLMDRVGQSVLAQGDQGEEEEPQREVSADDEMTQEEPIQQDAEQDHSESEKLLGPLAQRVIDQEHSESKEVEQEQPGQESSEPQVSEAAAGVHDTADSGIDESNELPQYDSEQEAEGDSWPDLDNFQYADENPEESTREEPEQGKDEIDIGQAVDVEADHTAPSHGAGDGQKVPFSDQNSSIGPAFFPSKPAYVSPYAVVQAAQPIGSTAGFASNNNQPASVAAPQVAAPPAPPATPPKPRHKRMAKHLRTSSAAATALGLPIPPSWTAFIRQTPTSAANPTGYAAAHGLIGRTPFNTQNKRTIARTGQEKGDFVGLVRNAFINNYLRLVHPNMPVFMSHGQKNRWFDTLPPWEQYEVRIFVMQQVEAKLPDDVATEVERLRNGSSTMTVGD